MQCNSCLRKVNLALSRGILFLDGNSYAWLQDPGASTLKRSYQCLKNKKPVCRKYRNIYNLCILQGALLEQLDMASVWQIFDAVALGYAEACATKQASSSVPVSPDSRGRASRLNMPVLTPQAWLLLLCL